MQDHSPFTTSGSQTNRHGATKRPVKGLIALASIVASLYLFSCAPGMISHTEVADTPTNRQIVNLVERYRQAMESRDTDTLKSMMSVRYYENASTTSTTEDDWGYPDADKVLGRIHNHLLNVNYEIKITRIQVSGPRADVFFDYTWSFQYTDGEQERWSRQSDVNRLELIQEDGGWKILSGM